MPRPHVLLHRPNTRFAAARVEAWEGKGPRSIPPRWETRLLKFLELSGVGRVVADGMDAEEARAAKLDEWIVGSGRDGRAEGKLITFSSLSTHLLRGVHTPGFAHSVPMRVGDLLIVPLF